MRQERALKNTAADKEKERQDQPQRKLDIRKQSEEGKLKRGAMYSEPCARSYKKI